MPSYPGRIDVHHHFVPAPYVKAYSHDPSGWVLPSWTAESSKDIMKELDIDVAVLSLTAPGTAILSGPAAVQLTRECNECAAAIRDADPSSFRFFASTPPILESIPAAITEIEYALDVLKADGVTLYTRYGTGNAYLGDDAFKPIWQFLSDRRAVVFVHPTHAADTRLVNDRLPQPFIDYPHETCRTIVDLIMNNRIREYPGVKIIVSHAGGTFPYLATRAAVMLPDFGSTTKSAEEVIADARELYYDLALSGNDYQLDLLNKFAKPENILFGSDFPYAPRNTVRTNTERLDNAEHKWGWDHTFRIRRSNALSLFPSLEGSVPKTQSTDRPRL